MTVSRYAIYYMPVPGPLAEFGAAWLGWDAATAQALPPPDIADLPMSWQDIVGTPRKYGFHATLKPPFRLADSWTEADLASAFRQFCTTQPPITLEGLELARLGRFLALVPLGNTGDLSQLAADTVRLFDPFRAPLSPEELSRRRAQGLSPAQEALLQRWGYPHVMELFRFHLTLTGKLPKAAAAHLYRHLSALLAPLLTDPVVINGLNLMAEGADGMFRVIERRELTG